MAKFASMVEVGTIELRGVDRPVFCACAIQPTDQKRICTYEKEDAQPESDDKDDDNDEDNPDLIDDSNDDDNDDDKSGDYDDVDNNDDDDDIIIKNQTDCKVRKSTFFSLNM